MGYVRQGAPGAGVGAFGHGRGDAQHQARHGIGPVQVVLCHATGDRTYGGAQDDAGHVVAQGSARHGCGAIEGREVLLLAVDADLGEGRGGGVGLDHRERQRGDHQVAVDRDWQRQADRIAGRRQAALDHDQHVGFIGADLGLVEIQQGLFQQRGVRAQLRSLAITRRGQVFFTQGFVDETGQVMAEGALVAVFQADHFRCVEGFHRVTAQVFHLGGHPLLLGFIFALEVFLVAQVGDHGFAFVGFLDFGARAVEVIQGQQVQGHLGGQHDFFVVVAFVATHFVVDQEAAELGKVLALSNLTDSSHV